jgi:hypothetical protein
LKIAKEEWWLSNIAITVQNLRTKPGIVEHTCNSSTKKEEAEDGEFEA